MRVVIAMMKHETNTFSPVPTPLSRFGNDGPYWGEAALRAYEGTGTPMGAFIHLARAEGAEMVTPVAAEAWPSGRVDDDAYRRLSDAIAEAVAKGCDLVLLDLHGAMVSQSIDDGDGALVERLRGIAPDTPIVAAFDLHANLSGKVVANATAVAGFKTYPHIDMYETGLRIGRIGFDTAKGECRPTMAWGNRPMMPHIMRQATAESPMRELIQAARQAEADGALAVSVFCGFPHADVPHAGLSAVAVTDRDMAGAEAVCGDLLTQAWLNRGGFVYHGEPAAEAVARAAKLAEGPIVLLDHCDNCGSGGTQDVMAVLAEILEQGLENVAAFAIHDPWAVDQMTQAGVGAEVTLPLGGKIDMPGIGRKGEPYTVTGTVKVLSGGTYTIQGPMYNGVEVHMGRTAVLDTGKVEIVVIERHHEPWDMGCLQSLGIEPTAKRYIMLKSRVHWRAGFWPVVRHVVECAGIGVTTSDYSQLNYTKVRRPIFPLDAEAGIEPEA